MNAYRFRITCKSESLTVAFADLDVTVRDMQARHPGESVRVEAVRVEGGGA